MRLLGITVMVACGLAVCAVSGESNFCSSADADIVIQQWQAVSSPDAAAKSKLSCGQAVFARLVTGVEQRAELSMHRDSRLNDAIILIVNLTIDSYRRWYT